jgi:hypothetical protein
MSKRRATDRPWRVLGYADADDTVQADHRFEGEFDEIVVGDWMHIERMNDHDWHVILGSVHLNVAVYKTKPAEVTFLFDDDDPDATAASALGEKR